MMLSQKFIVALLVGLLGGFSVYISVLGALCGLPVPAYLLSYLIILAFFPLIIKRKYILRFAWSRLLIWVLIIYVLYSVKYSLSHVVAHEKIVNIVYTIVAPLLIVDLMGGCLQNFSDKILNAKKNIIFFSKIFIFLSFLLFVLGFTVNYQTGRYGLVGMINPIWACRIFACLTLWIAYQFFYEKKQNFFSGILMLMGMYLVYKTGSNGPLLVLFLCSLAFFKDSLNLSKILLILFFLIIAVSIVLLSGRGAVSMLASYMLRFEMIEFVLELALKNIWFGNGIGSFGILFLNADEYYYPHNLLLEFYIEYGIIGVLLFMLPILLILRKSSLNYITIATAFYFINSMFSGDIVGNNFLFIFLYLSSFIVNCKKENT